ncbi:MAG: hypothetical protein GTN40_02300 [Candidatus Aenigmarchaeota archaeon]|nr:hypothetical protein [Candidatus Aenigmarchaeota archaeon]
MKDITLLVIIIIVLAIYFFYIKDIVPEKQNYTVPPEYKGSEGLDYIRKTYASELSQARSLCINQFKGNWVDTSNNLGCYDMQGFSSSYCNMEIINNIINLCKLIEGSPICSSTQASCTV